MTHLMLGMLAETFLHPGTGQTDGAIDLRVARESVTRHPFIPGSGMKGALKAHFRDRPPAAWQPDDLANVFGLEDRAGGVLISDARLLLLPVRSLSAPYLWLTCPLILERLLRDRSRCGFEAQPLFAALKALAIPGPGEVLINDVARHDRIFLEDRLFSVAGAVPPDAVRAFGALFHDEAALTAHRLSRQLCIVSDDDFAWAADNALPVAAHNVLAEGTKASRNLWYEENLPPDTLLYATLSARGGGDAVFKTLRRAVVDDAACAWLRIGANETTGLGWVGCRWLAKGAAA